MHDAVADVLVERAALDRSAGAAVLISVVLHAGLTALGIWAAMRSTPPKTATMVNIRFSPVAQARPAGKAPAARPPKPAAPKIEEPKPRIEEPKPAVAKKPARVEKDTVPFSPFGRSAKKGSEAPAVRERTPPAGAGGIGTTTAEVPIGGAGVTGLEGGDFPYTLYVDGMQRRIGSNWFRPQVAGGIATVVYFRILRNGTVAEAKIESPSGNAAFDRAALSAVRSSSPLNPLPPAYAGTYLGVHLTFR